MYIIYYMKTKNVKTSFSAVVELPSEYEDTETTVDVSLDKDIDYLTYDEVEDAIYDAVNKKYGIEYDEDEILDDDIELPTIIDLVINETDGESYPVVAESDEPRIAELKSSHAYLKYLVLPDAKYQLTQECKLWLDMKKHGMIDEDAEFDFEKYHEFVEILDEKK